MTEEQTMGRMFTGTESHHLCRPIATLAVALAVGTIAIAANFAPQHPLVGKRFTPADIDYGHVKGML